ncbi:hypothetical protein ASD76_11100 [Altererythrobacter sp. Root672]|nr:hypothetical protein ASD76_11100 [Altererythrobacter sp. Root672]
MGTYLEQVRDGAVHLANADIRTQATAAGHAAATAATAAAEAALSKGASKAVPDVEAPNLPPKLTIRDHNEHHQAIVADLKTQLKDLGYQVSDKEISFGDSCGAGRCRPDIVYVAPNGKVAIIEVKTGDAELSIRQSEIFPQIRDGDSIPRGQVAKDFDLVPDIPLKDQGYPNGIPIYEQAFPGLGK